MTPDSIAQAIADQFAALPQVVAVALAGSRTATTPDERSDFDFYIYSTEPIPVEDRKVIASQFADEDKMELDNQFWEPGDEWPIRGTNWSTDIMFRSPRYIEQQLDRVLVHHWASMGYTTCFWFNVSKSRALFDRNGWFAALQTRAKQPYPEALQQAIIAKNYPILRTMHHSSYLVQLQSAVTRDDLVSIQHRSAAMLASYFDILFAVNKALHPGEKRLINYAKQLPKIPVNFEQDVTAFVLAACAPDHVVAAGNRLLDSLDELLEREGFIPAQLRNMQ